MPDKDLILILGAGRSGTSAITRVLSLCGCNLPHSLVGATSMNPSGHWEPVEATHLNIEFVTRHNLVSDSSMQLDDIEIDEREKREFIEKIQSFLSSCPKGQPLVIKEFRINELLSFWHEAARRSGYSVKVLIALRHPQEVYASLNKAFSPTRKVGSAAQQRQSREAFNIYWLKSNLLAEHHSRGLPRIVVEYSNLLKDWRSEIKRISQALSVDLKTEDTPVEEFLNPSLHKQRYVGPVMETFAYSWTTRVYSILATAAQDGPIDTPSLDEIYHGYHTNARAFRIATAETQAASNKFLREFVDGLPVWKSGQDF